MKVTSQSPVRISLFGGGTDVNPYASKYGGVCINIAISIKQRIDVSNSTFSLGNAWSYQHGDNTTFFKKIAQKMNASDIWMKHRFSGPIESGIGSSASAAVALIGAVAKVKGLNLSKEEIAKKAWDIEVNELKLFGGKQDQYCAAFGGMNTMYFNKDGVKVERWSRPIAEKIAKNLVLIYTGRNRKSSKIQERFKKLTPKSKIALDKLKSLAELVDLNKTASIKIFAEWLNLNWEYKKQSNKGVTNDRIDKIYNFALNSGALAGKISGAGGGGFAVFIVRSKNQKYFIKQMKKVGCKHYPFKIDWKGLVVK